MSILKYPLTTEKAVRYIDTENKLVFVVERSATKQQIKEEIERTLNAKVVNVNTHNDAKGTKRAYVTFSPQTPALDIATTLGLM